MAAIHDFYNKLLSLCNIEVDHDGRLKMTVGDQDYPLEVEKLAIVFPEKQFLSKEINKEQITFHPLSESTVRLPSEVQEILRRAAILKFNMVGREILSHAVDLNSKITSDTSFKPNHKLAELFGPISKVDDKFMKWWGEIEEAMNNDPSNLLFTVYLKQGGEVDGSKFDRVTTIASPFYDSLYMNAANNIFGVPNPAKRIQTTMFDLLGVLFPDLKDGGYQVGSSNVTAPTLASFIETIAKMQTRFNELMVLFGKEKGDLDGIYNEDVDITHNVDWKKLRNALPADKKYNVGTTKEDAEATKPKPKRAAPKPPVSLNVETKRVEPTTDVEPEYDNREADTELKGSWFRESKRDRESTWGGRGNSSGWGGGERVYRDHRGRITEAPQRGSWSGGRRGRDESRPRNGRGSWFR